MRINYSTAGRQAFVQIAYHVADLDEAMGRWSRLFGVGPFLVRRHIDLSDVRYRGHASALSISAAHAQSGDIQIELVMQHGDDRSMLRDMFAPHEEGLHHLALFPEDHDALVSHYVAAGCPVSTELVTGEGRGASFVDCRSTLGHMIEIYRVNESLVRFYADVARLGRDWDGATVSIEEGDL